MNKREFIIECKKIGIEITEEIYNKFSDYCTFLINCNKKINLTAITKEEDVFLKHFYDSLCLTKIYNFSSKIKVLDIGTGAGFPTMPLKIIYPNINLTLIESNSKKCKFLEFLLKKLEINDVEIVNQRAEIYAKENREVFDIVTCRAVASLNILSEIAIPLVKINGLFIPLKTNNEEELENAKSIINKTGALLKEVFSYKLPIENAERSIIVIEKKIKTNLDYPRDYKYIIKK